MMRPTAQAFTAAFRRDFRILTASDLRTAWEVLMREQVHVMIADQRLPGAYGSDILHLVREHHPSVRRMLMTGYADLQAVIDAINLGGVSHYITKPWDPVQVLSAVSAAYADYCKEEDRLAYTARLVEANKQLEFALRQQLLS
jgi:response regulator RpfG family c-di-GMP phosphodiesterase